MTRAAIGEDWTWVITLEDSDDAQCQAIGVQTFTIVMTGDESDTTAGQFALNSATDCVLRSGTKRLQSVIHPLGGTFLGKVPFLWYKIHFFEKT